MRVRWRVTGGVAAIPGLSMPRAVDSSALPQDQREALEALVRDARFFTLPSSLPPPPGAADYRQYDIEIEDGPRRHRVVAADPVADAPLRALIDRLQRL